jgi:hypothetical protein
MYGPCKILPLTKAQLGIFHDPPSNMNVKKYYKKQPITFQKFINELKTIALIMKPLMNFGQIQEFIKLKYINYLNLDIDNV